MSPEQCQGKRLDDRSDLYSLGCLMYETLTGVPPLMGINSFETMTKHVNEKPVSMRQVVPHAHISDSIDAAVLSTLRKKPSRRPSSAKELKALLIECAEESGIKFKHAIDWDDYTPLSSSRYATFREAEESDEKHRSVSVDGSQDNRADNLLVAPGNDRGANAQNGPASRERAEPCESANASTIAKDSAMQLTPGKRRDAQKLRQSIILLGSLLFLTLTAIGAYLTMPGPAQDPATNWQRIAWHSAMTDGEREASIYRRTGDAGDKEQAYKWAIKSFKQAIQLGVGMGALSDKRQQAERALLHMYEEHHDDEFATALREVILRHHQERMVAIYGQDIANEMRKGDEALIWSKSDFNLNGIRIEKLLEYSQFMLERAKESLAKKQYNSALNFLSDAVALEEKSHGVNGKETTRCATELCQKLTTSNADRSEIDRAERLMKRSEEAQVEN